jgi:hypothetical protein
MKRFILPFLSLAILFSCANPLPPSGGPPDTTPPEIVSYYPPNKTLDFKDNEVRIEFSKYMDKNKVIENLFISPLVKVEYDWSGKELTINFIDTLISNRTYAIILGTDYTDIYHNKPASAFTLIFSTGQALDSASIVGKIFDENPGGTYIYAYFLDVINPDTLNPAHTKPDYFTQAGQNGNFQFKALKPGKYRIFSVVDKFNDKVYNEGIDNIACYNEDVIVRNDSTPSIRLRIGKIIDKQPPILLSTEYPYLKMITASFSKSMDTNSINPKCFKITDSAQTKEIGITSTFLSPLSAKKVDVITEKELTQNVRWKLLAIADTNLCIRDSSGNFINDTANHSYFRVPSKVDTLIPVFYKLPFKDSSVNAPRTGSFDFVFNTAIKDGKIISYTSMMKMSDSMPVHCKIFWRQPNILSVQPITILDNDTWYVVNLNIKDAESAYGIKMKDSIINLRLKTIDTRSYGSCTGTIKGLQKDLGTPVLVLISKKSRDRFTAIPDSNGTWKVDGLPPDSYRFEMFYDKVGNRIYDFGNPSPFKPSEVFYQFDKIVDLPPRWKVENVGLEVK